MLFGQSILDGKMIVVLQTTHFFLLFCVMIDTASEKERTEYGQFLALHGKNVFGESHNVNDITSTQWKEERKTKRQTI